SHFGGFESLPFTMADEFANGKVYRMTEWMDFWEVAVDGSLTKFDDADLYNQWTAMGYAPFNYAMAYDWNTERMYIAGDDGLEWPVGYPHLAYFDLETFELIYVGQINIGGMIVGMDFADDGKLYGVGVDGKLYKISVDEFDVEIVGNTGLGSINKDIQDLSYDRVDHILYGVLRDNSYFNKFGTINIETGEFTIIQDYTDYVGYSGFAITRDPSQVHTLTFTIDDGENPIEGAEIEIDGEILTTNASGMASTEIENGTYDYTVTYTGYYDDEGTVTIDGDDEEVLVSLDLISGINSMENGFNISPNPSQGRYKISMEKDFTFDVYDINGIKIYSNNKASTESTLDISSQAKGIYFLKIRTKTDSKIFKLIKE
ncbi:MAG: T9SS type A sorting domain-containing protein, partial [Bacteroidales bacterium]|nr:T9SS type A sorting domain-containing protein [Bacteroidales bacterium]